jgi:hypothetical protein
MYYSKLTLRVSGNVFAHHQEHLTVFTVSGSVHPNEELDKLREHKNIINHIKAQRLSWFGHVQRRPDTRTVKKIFNWKPLSKR